MRVALVVITSVLVAVSACKPKEAVVEQKSCAWPEELDAVRAAPDSHKVIFENEHVRVLEVTVAPHSKEPIHAHCWPSTAYIQQMGNIIDRNAQGEIIGDTTQLPQKPSVPFAAWGPPEGPHSIENLDDVPLKMIRVEQKD